MSECCDPKAPKVYPLNIGGDMVGLIGLKQAFLDVKSLGLVNEKPAEILMEIVKKRNFVPETAELEYKVAILAEFKKYIAKSTK